MNYWLRSGLLTLLEKGSGLVFSLGTAMLLWRGLPQTQVASWGVFLLVTAFLEMGRSGLIQNGLVRYLSLHHDEPAIYAAVASASLVLNIAFSIVSNVVLWASMYWLSRNQHAAELPMLLSVYFITNFVMAWLYHCNFVQQANLEFRGIFWATFFLRGGLFAWVAGCWWLHRPVQLVELAWIFLACAIVATLATWWIGRPYLRHRFVVDRVWVTRLLQYGKYVMGTNLCAMFYKNIDKLVLGNLLGQASYAIYDAAAKITQMVEAPSFSVAAVVFPQNARTTDSQDLRNLYENSVSAILAIVLPFLLLTLVFAEPIVLILAGREYVDSANILRLTAFFGLFMPFAVQFGTLLDATGLPAANFKYVLGISLLNLTFCWIGVSLFGLSGAAYGMLVGYIISFFAMQYRLRRDYDIRWMRVLANIPSVYRLGWDIVAQRMAWR